MSTSKILFIVLYMSCMGFLACFLLSINCVHTPPVPTLIDAGRPSDADVLYGITADCGLSIVAQQRSVIIDSVRTCLDAANTGVCLVELSKTASKDAIVCVVQDFDMTLHHDMALGIANKAMKVEAAAASAWIRAEQVGVRR